MDNRGKLWSIDDDQKLMEAPGLPNSYFAQNMGRTEYAIMCRRNHIAAKMHQNDPSSPLEECVRLMHADFAQASILLGEWTVKRQTIKTFMDNNRKRKLLPPPPPSAAPAALQPQDARDELITFVCKRICDEGGNLESLWNTPHLLACLVQNYQGFEAYARAVRVLGVQ
jgi:hypothetical protein